MLKMKLDKNSMGNHIKKSTVACALILSLVFTVAPAETFAASKAPGQPKITKATVYSNNNVKLQWSKSKNAVKYKVYRKKTNGKFVLVKTTKSRTYYSKKLAYGTKYTYKVKAISKSGKAKTSKSKVAYTKPAKPVITAKVFDTNNVKVTWKKVKGAKKYKVYRKKADGKFVLMKTTSSLSYSNEDVSYDTQYTYKVKAISAAGRYTESALKKVVTGGIIEDADASGDVDDPNIPDEPVVPDSPTVPDEPKIPDCEKDGHNYQVITIGSATCTTPAYKEFKCSRCEATKTETTSPQLGHNWVYKNTVEPTYTEDGFDRYGCSRCSEYKYEPIPKLESPEVPETPVTPSEPVQPDEPEKPERTVTVKVPIYETDTVYWIKSYEGEIIFKSTDNKKWHEILVRPSIIIDGVEYDPRVTYGSGAFDSDGDGYEDEQYKIIVDYYYYTMTESEWNESYWNGIPGVTFEYNE